MSDLEDASEYEEAPPSGSTNKRPRRSTAGNSTTAAPAPAPAKGRGGARGAAAKKNSGSNANANGLSQSPADGHPNDTDEGNDPASARKLQNRTAQREFRQRKLQYVKDLEARVEFLSSPRDDQLEILKALLHGFIEENKQLRHLVQAISGFVGTGMGGKSWELGFKKDEDYEDFVKRSDKDTLHRLYEEWQVKMQAEKDAQSKDPDSGCTGDSGGTGRSAPAKRGSAGAKNGLAASTSRASSPAPAPATRANSGSSSKRKAGGNGNARSEGQHQDDVSPPPPYPPTSAGASGTMSNAQRLASLTGLQRADNASPDGDERRQSPVTSMSASSRSTVQNPGFPPLGQPQQQQQQYPPQQQQPSLPQSAYESTGFGYASAGPSMGPSAGRGRLPIGSTFNPSSAFGLMGTNLSSSAPASEYSGQHNQSQNNFGRQQPYGSNSWSMPSASMSDFTGSGSAPASSGFFFDTAEPLSMPTSSFTNDFLSEYVNTGLTPMFDAAPFGGPGAGYNWYGNEGGAMTGNLGPTGVNGSAHDHDTPSSSTSSNYVAQPQQPFQPIGSSLSGPPLTNLQQQIAFEDKYRQKLEDKVVANAHRFKLPKGITPEDVINSSPLLALIHTISYHMRNKATNPDYVLPDVLKPTPLQISTPHDFRIDGLLFAGIRDRMILNTEYDLDDVFADLVDSTTIHPGEVVLDPGNCEISEGFLRKYKNLISEDALAVSNKWRKSRGEPEIVL